MVGMNVNDSNKIWITDGTNLVNEGKPETYRYIVVSNFMIFYLMCVYPMQV